MRMIPTMMGNTDTEYKRVAKLQILFLILASCILLAATARSPVATLAANLGMVGLSRNLGSGLGSNNTCPYGWMTFAGSHKRTSVDPSCPIQYLQLATRLQAHRASTHKALGLLYAAIDEPRLSADHLAYAVTLNQNDELAQAALVTLFPILDAETQVEIMQVLKLAKGKVVPLLISLADCYRWEKRWDALTMSLELALHLDPQLVQERAVIHRGLGEAYLRYLDQPSKAIPHLKEAVALSPSDGYAHAMLGEWFLRQRRIVEATSELELAVALGPSPYHDL